MTSIATDVAPSTRQRARDAVAPTASGLCDDTLLRILSYADLPSLVRFARGTSKSLRRRLHPEADENGDLPDVWRRTFAGLNLAPVEDEPVGRGFVQDGGSRARAPDYFEVVRERLALWHALRGDSARRRRKKGGKTTKQCLSLPDRMFHFVPLVPPDMMRFPPDAGGGDGMIFTLTDHDHDDDSDDERSVGNAHVHDDDFETMAVDPLDVRRLDPPPVEFSCDSFALTSPADGGEFVLLNPFAGTIELYDDVLDNAVASAEGTLERALLDASEGIARKRAEAGGGRSREEEEDDERSEVIAGEAIDRRFGLSEKLYDTPPRQVLFSMDDYFNLDLAEYFGPHTPFVSRGRRNGGNVTVDWVGVDSHPALGEDCLSIRRNVIGAARILTMESDGGEEELACTEVLAWGGDASDASKGDAPYGTKYVCRAAGSFYFLDICAKHERVYAAFQEGDCPFDEGDATRMGDRNDGRPQLMDIEDESVVNDDGGPIRTSRAVYRLPLVRRNEASPPCPRAIDARFPSPDARILADYPVSAFSVDPTGDTLVVGTTHGTVEVWDTGLGRRDGAAKPARLQILSVREAFLRRQRSMTMDGRRTSSRGTEEDEDKPDGVEVPEAAGETQDDLALLDAGAADEEDIPHKHPTAKVSQVYLPRHLPARRCGFVTKQRSAEHGTTLLLWQTPGMFGEDAEKEASSADEPFRMTAMINVPLAAQCHPEVHFDGRRLVVFGRDHIGLIFLVYHVLGTRFDQSEFDEATVPERPAEGSRVGEESGGVVHLGAERRIRFVNRVRHAGLDGLEYYDSMLLSANERFLVANTKAGNLVGEGGSHNAREGLLVVDLQDQGRR